MPQALRTNHISIGCLSRAKEHGVTAAVSLARLVLSGLCPPVGVGFRLLRHGPYHVALVSGHVTSVAIVMITCVWDFPL